MKLEYKVSNVIEVAQSLGGIGGIFLAFFSVLGRSINKQVIFAKFIRSLFYIQKEEKEKKT
jgi:hypothetical protein